MSLSAVTTIIAGMHSRTTRTEAASLRAAGATLSETSRRLRVSRSTLRAWEDGRAAAPARPCPRCDGSTLDAPAYATLLGLYLGDGCISRAPRSHTLRVSCDERYPAIIDDVTACVAAVRPGTVFHVTAPGCVVVSAHWRHWPCLFPQHGPGRKHERPIVLEDWQRQVVEAHPGAFLRGLFHSDGCRVRNWTQRTVAGELKRYDYPRWQFVNASADIRELCCWALDLVGVAWRQSNRRTISVSRREAVAALDALIGPKG
jgi:hypothetical protein